MSVFICRPCLFSCVGAKPGVEVTAAFNNAWYNGETLRISSLTNGTPRSVLSAWLATYQRGLTNAPSFVARKRSMICTLVCFAHPQSTYIPFIDGADWWPNSQHTVRSLTVSCFHWCHVIETDETRSRGKAIDGLPYLNCVSRDTRLLSCAHQFVTCLLTGSTSAIALTLPCREHYYPSWLLHSGHVHTLLMMAMFMPRIHVFRYSWASETFTINIQLLAPSSVNRPRQTCFDLVWFSLQRSSKSSSSIRSTIQHYF